MKALGMIEVYGYLAAVEALDSALKAANVTMVDVVLVQGGLVTVLITGDVGAVKAAMDASRMAAERVGKVISVHVIPRPSERIEKMLPSRAVNTPVSRKSSEIVSGQETTASSKEDETLSMSSGPDSGHHEILIVPSPEQQEESELQEEPRSQREVELQEEPESQGEVGLQLNPESQGEVGLQAKPESQSEVELQQELESQSEEELQPELESQSEVELQQEPESQTEVEQQPEQGLQLEVKQHPESELRQEQKANSKVLNTQPVKTEAQTDKENSGEANDNGRERKQLTSEHLKEMTVERLRSLARELGITNMTRKQIRFATKHELIDSISKFIEQER
jgi:ethanolamine utilization protein EutM